MADGAQYGIDIGAKTTGIDTASAQLDKLISSLDGAGVANVSLDEALAASAANYARLEEASIRASKALESATNAAAKIDQLKQSSADATAKMDAQAAAVQAAESALAALNAQEGSSAASIANASAAVDAANAKYMTLAIKAESAKRALDKAVEAGGRISELQSAADSAAAAVAAEAKTLDDLRAASAAAADEQEKLSVAMKNADKAASEADKQVADGARSLKDLAKQSAGPAGETIEKLSGAMGLLANPTVAAGVAVGALVLGCVALAAALVVGVAQLAKFAVTLNKVQMERLNKATEKAKGNLGKLFSGVHVEKFVDAYEDVLGLLDESNSAAQGVKAILSAMLNPLFDSASTLGPLLKEFFRGLVLGALLTAVAVVKARNAIAKLIPDGALSGLLTMQSALEAGKYAFMAIAAVVVIAAVVLAVFFAALAIGCAVGLIALLALPIAIVLIVAAVAALGYAIYTFAGKAIAAIGGFVSSAVAYLASLASAAYSAGSNIIQGLLNSIASGSGMVMQALRNLGGSAINALKGALGIHSPSKYALEFGQNITETFSGTVEDGSGDATAAMESMAEPPDMPSFESARASAKSQSSQASAGRSVTVTGPFNFYGVAGAEDAENRFAAMFTRILEGDVTQLGGETVPA